MIGVGFTEPQAWRYLGRYFEGDLGIPSLLFLQTSYPSGICSAIRWLYRSGNTEIAVRRKMDDRLMEYFWDNSNRTVYIWPPLPNDYRQVDHQRALACYFLAAVSESES